MLNTKTDRAVSRITRFGASLYMLVPLSICEKAGIKRGDRVALDTDGRTVYFARIPFEELINRRSLVKEPFMSGIKRES